MADNDTETLVNLVHSLANRLNELTEQHMKDVRALETRIANVERSTLRLVDAYAIGHEVLR